MSREITVLATGPQALIQDLGRPGHAHLGIPPSGALDTLALRQANRLVGNDEAAAGIELLIGGLRVRAQCPCTIAVTGPPIGVTVNDRATDSHTPVHLDASDILEVGTLTAGLRCYVAFGGGLAVVAELGSRSTDLLSGIGPEPLAANLRLPLGPAGIPFGVDELAPEPVTGDLTVPISLGPREYWFDEPGRQLATARWSVSEKSNRVGLCCTGPALRRAAEFDGVELASEGIITGAVQVPTDGRPLIFLADHPTTGGYPVLGVVPAHTLPALAQARPGTPLHFHPSR
ncbi:MAG: biotin-dependent carboxyltransferase family protein [Sciscionella sp.]